MYHERLTDHGMRVLEFMRKAGQEVPELPQIPSLEVRKLRARLILEECLETVEALGFRLGTINAHTGLREMELVEDGLPNLVEIADGCADISVVTIGTLLACGIPDYPVLEEVDHSNLAKFRGDAHRCPKTGKWIKPTDWTPPDLLGVLESLAKTPFEEAVDRLAALVSQENVPEEVKDVLKDNLPTIWNSRWAMHHSTFPTLTEEGLPPSYVDPDRDIPSSIGPAVPYVQLKPSNKTMWDPKEETEPKRTPACVKCSTIISDEVIRKLSSKRHAGEPFPCINCGHSIVLTEVKYV